MYETAPGTLGLFCLHHWELLPTYARNRLEAEDTFCREAGRRTERWLKFLRIAVEAIQTEEEMAAIREEMGLPKKGSTPLEAASCG